MKNLQRPHLRVPANDKTAPAAKDVPEVLPPCLNYTSVLLCFWYHIVKQIVLTDVLNQNTVLHKLFCIRSLNWLFGPNVGLFQVRNIHTE